LSLYVFKRLIDMSKAICSAKYPGGGYNRPGSPFLAAFPTNPVQVVTMRLRRLRTLSGQDLHD
jgi:hypothetical protein